MLNTISLHVDDFIHQRSCRHEDLEGWMRVYAHGAGPHGTSAVDAPAVELQGLSLPDVPARLPCVEGPDRQPGRHAEEGDFSGLRQRRVQPLRQIEGQPHLSRTISDTAQMRHAS